MPVLTPRALPAPTAAYCNESNISEVLGVTGALTVLAVLTVGLRIYVRISMLHFCGPDDWVMAAAAVLAIGTFVCFVGETHHGIGSHATCIGEEELEMLLKWQFFHGLWNTTGVILVKISIALFLWRLAPKPAWKWFLGGCIAFLICFGLACAGTLIFACIPVAAYWNFALQAKAKCFSPHTFTSIGLFNSIISIITDFLFAFLPIPIIVKMRVNRRTKITLGVILSLGLIACAAGIVKAHLQTTFLEDPDRYWHDGFMVWGLIEFCLGMLAASLPVLRPLFSAVLVNTRSTFWLQEPGQTTGHRTYPTVARNSGYKRQDSSGPVQLGVFERPVSTMQEKPEHQVAMDSVHVESKESLQLPVQRNR